MTTGSGDIERRPGPYEHTDTRAGMVSAARCPHCMLCGCVLVAIKLVENRGMERDNSPVNKLIAWAANLPLQAVDAAELVVLGRLSDHLSVDQGTMDFLLEAYARDPVRKAWWAHEEESVTAMRRSATAEDMGGYESSQCSSSSADFGASRRMSAPGARL